MRASPGSAVFVTEGEANAEALIKARLLATTVLSHHWAPECVAALTGHHLIILQDHDKEGAILANAAQKKLIPVAASTRIVPTAHLWKHLPGAGEPAPGDDVQDWIARGGDLRRLLDVCHEIPAIAALLESVCASDVEIEDYDWIWPGRFALKKIGLIAGLPEEGKGLAISDIVARITRGALWPCNEGQAPLGNVIMLSAEDDISDTIVPRLIASDADLARITILKMVHEADSKERMFSLITDLNVLRQKILEISNVKMIVVDPVTAYLGIGKVDSFRATDVRAVLSPLKELAEELRVSVLGIMHFNKKIDVTNVLLRISDSLAYGAASRHVYAVNDPDNHRRLFVKGKNNLARYEQKTLAFSINEREVGADKRTGNPIRRPYIIWHDEPVDITAIEAMQAAADSKSPSARDTAKRFIEALLSSGPVSSTEVQEAAKENGISRSTLRRAQEDLRIDVRRDGPLNDKGERTWQWHLPGKTED
jgi:hypothetical protein